MRGTNFYNKTENVVVWAFLHRKHKNDIYNEKSYPFCGIFTLQRTEDGEYD